MSASNAVFVLVHGGWHNHSAWDRVTGQDHMIATVDAALGGKTTTHTLESSHSPFLSQPAKLSRMLIDIGVQSLTEQSAEALEP